MDNKLKNGEIITESPNMQLFDLDFCRKVQASELATIIYRIVEKMMN